MKLPDRVKMIAAQMIADYVYLLVQRATATPRPLRGKEARKARRKVERMEVLGMEVYTKTTTVEE
jgi:hypothetical protein